MTDGLEILTAPANADKRIVIYAFANEPLTIIWIDRANGAVVDTHELNLKP